MRENKTASDKETKQYIGRPKKYWQYELPESVVRIVQALCADYERRVIELGNTSLNPAVKERYKNDVSGISLALAFIDDSIKNYMICDIGTKAGYEGSVSGAYLSRKAYYSLKRKAIYEIAIMLSLI